MSTMYTGEHAVIFEPTDGSAGKNTWDDWFLIPTTRPTMSIPAAQLKFVEVPGMNGSYDLSSYLTSDIALDDRSGNFEFAVDNGHAAWSQIYNQVADYLHGQRLRMRLTDDPEWYYEGRFNLDEFKSDPNNSKIVISYRVLPFKISIQDEFMEHMIWDQFYFERDEDWSVLYHLETTAESEEFGIVSYGTSFVVDIRLVSGGPVTASFGGITKNLTTANVIEALGRSNRSGRTTLTLTGAGVVDVGWKKTSL